jgi:hypothetical protein
MRSSAAILVILISCLADPSTGNAAPNLSTPDATLLMPFDSTEGNVFFSMITNVGESVVVTIDFYDEDGAALTQTTVPLKGKGDTVVVDPTRLVSVDEHRNPVSPMVSLFGKRGCIIAKGGDGARLVGTFTLANWRSGASYGSTAVGIGPVGAVGALVPGDTLVGNIYDISAVEEAFLILVAVDPDRLTPLQGGFSVELEVARARRATEFDEEAMPIARSRLSTSGAVLFPSVIDLFNEVPNCNLVTDASCSTALRVSSQSAIVGFLGQSVASYGAAAPLRALD